MRTIERSSAFKRDFKRVRATPRHSKDVDSFVSTVVASLLIDQALPESNRDHALSGDWAGYRECHIKPDLLLIYRSQMPTPCDWRGLAHTVNYLLKPTKEDEGTENIVTRLFSFSRNDWHEIRAQYVTMALVYAPRSLVMQQARCSGRAPQAVPSPLA